MGETYVAGKSDAALVGKREKRLDEIYKVAAATGRGSPPEAGKSGRSPWKDE